MGVWLCGILILALAALYPDQKVVAMIGSESTVKTTPLTIAMVGTWDTPERLHDCWVTQKGVEGVRIVSSKRCNPSDPNTVALVLNTCSAADVAAFPCERILGLAAEPRAFLGLTPEFVRLVQDRFGLGYHLGKSDGLSSAFREHFMYQWHIPAVLSQNGWAERPRKMSLVWSGKTWLDGHKYRETLCREAIRCEMDIDLYGQGPLALKNLLRPGQTRPRIMGPFKELEPFDTYRFHIAIENTVEPAYVSEKYMNAVQRGCVPIYLGATRVSEFFGAKCCIPLSGDGRLDVALLQSVLANPNSYFLDVSAAANQLKPHGDACFTDFVAKAILGRRQP